MKYSIKKKMVTGSAIPVSALRSSKSCGIGEFTDLKLFGDWCKESGLDLIQLLPVNDTGLQSSPYSALSAFALHPIYINFNQIKEAKKYKNEISKLQKKWGSKKKISFNSILKDKNSLLKTIFTDNLENIKKSRNIKAWEKENTWVESYAVFSFLKEKNKNKSWEFWKKHKNATPKEIKKIYKENRDNMFFYSWVQMNLEFQLSESAEYLESIGINLKGDLPILMNMDSADVWEFRDIFKINNRAGAPPDMFSEIGQNWGFPTYSWESMERDNFSWWKARLKQAAKFYHAYRIDHVLGFFRIWTIPEKYEHGSMGYYSPNNFMSLEELSKIGFGEDRLKWLSVPHVPGYELRESLGVESKEATEIFLDQIGTEDLYLFKNSIKSVFDITNSKVLSVDAKSKMVEFFQNITLLKIADNAYIATWFFYNTRAYHTLSDHEKYQLGELLNNKSEQSMNLWKTQGLKLLKFMKESEDMLVCAEDLGVVPDCVPEVLSQLGILSLNVMRWSKKYNEYGEPFIKPREYNPLSVATLAVHDSSTVRQWWSEFPKTEVAHAMNFDEPFNKDFSTQEVKRLYSGLLKTSAKIAIFQFQDLLAIDEKIYRKDMDSERINVPGTVNNENWSYRMDGTLESLIENKVFSAELKKLISERG